jgi:hypothetical protein
MIGPKRGDGAMRRAVLLKYGFLTVLAFFSFCLICQAQENITITTYYPSPDASYNNLDANFLQADRIAVGNGNNAAGLPDGVLSLQPLNAAPAGAAGSLYYNNNVVPGVLNYHNGNMWFPIQPAVLVPFGNATTLCIPVGTHVVSVLTNARRGASMEPCDALNGASAGFVAAGIAEPNCMPTAGFIICH